MYEPIQYHKKIVNEIKYAFIKVENDFDEGDGYLVGIYKGVVGEKYIECYLYRVFDTASVESNFRSFASNFHALYNYKPTYTFVLITIGYHELEIYEDDTIDEFKTDVLETTRNILFDTGNGNCDFGVDNETHTVLRQFRIYAGVCDLEKAKKEIAKLLYSTFAIKDLSYELLKK